MAEMNFKQIRIMKLFEMSQIFYMLLNTTNHNIVPKEIKIGIVFLRENITFQYGKC